MSGGFDGANLALSAAGYDGESGFHGGPFVIRINFEVAEEFFGGGVLHIERLEVGAWAQTDFGDQAGESGGVFLAVGDGACDGVDDDVLGAGIVLGAVGILDAEHVAGTLDESVLKASAGAEKRPVTAAGEFDSLEHAVEALVGTAGGGPDSVQAFEQVLGVRGENGWSRDPWGIELDL